MSPRPTPEHLATWRELVNASRLFALRPMAPAGRLTRAAVKAGRAVVPGDLSKDSPFVQLVEAAKAWGLKLGSERMEAAAELERLADACALVLDPPAPAPEPRRRADVFE